MCGRLWDLRVKRVLDILTMGSLTFLSRYVTIHF
jgi:hypothetical protein